MVFFVKLYVGCNLQSLFGVWVFCFFFLLAMRLFNYALMGSCLLTFRSKKPNMFRRWKFK
ncbi:hypothetical protein ASC74_27280 [Pseudomonas sp. Root329]|nr:hypothetical protein ASC74_27280 [Pseudomonas sp. Root329]